jgi:ABC-type glycerol-3-phosphate transport system substrate-binding protein
MKKTSKLQVGIYIGVIFIILIVVFIFLGVIPGLREQTFNTNITVWGTYPEDVFRPAISAWREESVSISITYVQKNPATYSGDITEAIATGDIPDIIILPDTLLHKIQNKLAPVPALHVTQREYIETFTGVTNIFMQNDVIYGIPFAVDPLVLYWNRDFFASEAIALPPSTWDIFLLDVQKLTKRTVSGNITRAGTAMGITSNIPQAIDIISLLILQGGTSIIDPQTHIVTLGEQRLDNEITVSSTQTALRFYTDFAKREKTSYTWNHTFTNPVDAFVREDLAMFIAPASTYSTLTQRAPHIDIGVSPVPQYSQAPVKIGYARTLAFTVPLQSQKQSVAWRVVKFLSQQPTATIIANHMWLAPARRDLLGIGHGFPPFSVFYEEALRSRTWYNPDPTLSKPILTNMIESVSAGRDVGAAAAEARERLVKLLK